MLVRLVPLARVQKMALQNIFLLLHGKFHLQQVLCLQRKIKNVYVSPNTISATSVHFAFQKKQTVRQDLDMVEERSRSILTATQMEQTMDIQGHCTFSGTSTIRCLPK